MAARALDPLDHLDASLQDFEPSIGSPPPFGYPSMHSGFRSDDTMASSDLEDDSASAASVGGYSPPAWRRLGNGDRSSGFWRKSDNLSRLGLAYNHADPRSRESSPEYESADEGEAILARAIRTRLPDGSVSPMKERSPEPEYAIAPEYQTKEEEEDDDTTNWKGRVLPKKGAADNCKCSIFSKVAFPWILVHSRKAHSLLFVGRYSLCATCRGSTKNRTNRVSHRNATRDSVVHHRILDPGSRGRIWSNARLVSAGLLPTSTRLGQSRWYRTSV